ncbi:MAG: Sensor histidine kinase RcsC [Acidobacteria bacterium]|nr:Sensor histidine kinase RcsC [Acidobacteriota bacterium]
MVARLRHTSMSAQYRFSLIYVLGLFTLVTGAVVIVMACLAMANWIFGGGVFGLQVSNSNRFGATLGITPDAALCFILCGISLWVLRESAGKGAPAKSPAEKFLPTEKFLVEAALMRASLVKISDDGSEQSWNAASDKTESEGTRVKSFARNFARRGAQFCASVAAAISVAVLIGYAAGWDAGVGGWLAQLGVAIGNLSAPEGVSAQMAPSAACAFLLNGIALATLDVETRRGARPAQYLALIAFLLSLVVALGHAYQTSLLHHWFFAAWGWPEMTALMAVIFIALSIGVVCARPRSGVVSLLTSDSAGGYLARRLAPAAIVVPAALNWLRLYGERARYFDSSSGMWLLAVTNILFFLILIWRCAISLHNVDTERALAETSLYNAYSDLQKRVGEQSAEIQRANQDLWAEMIERERVEAELTQRHDELFDFMENAPVGAHSVGPDGTIVWANKAELNLLGYTRDEYVGHHISEFHIDRRAVEEMWRRLWQGEELDNYEVGLRARDGSIRHALINSNVLWKDGGFVHTRGFIRDITRSKQVEESLLESERRAWALLRESEAQAGQYQMIADTAPVMIWMSGADKVFNFFNKRWLDYTGRKMEQELENGWAEGIHPEDFEHCLETYVEAFNARREFRMEYRLRRSDGQYRWILNYGAPFFNSNGANREFAGYIGSCVDIHERKEAEELLRLSEEFNRGILESSADCIKTLDLDGRLISMNKTGMKIMGIDDFSHYSGAVWADLMEGAGRAAARDAIETAKAGGVGHFIGSCKTTKGELKWWDVIVSPALNRRGKPECLMAISRDITEARQLESERNELLSRAQAARGQAEDANRLKDEFLATVSHELRAPLNAIQGWVKLLRDGRLKPDEAARALETIERSTRSQNRIISDLLDVSRIITGKLRLNVRPIEPARVIESAVEALRPGADAKEINIELVLDDEAGPISGDSDRLRQIVWNLVSNAIKFTPKQGCVQVRLERAGANVEIIVSDTGVGIDPDFLPFVFDRFRQGDSSSTRRQGGLGLGLAIVRHLVEMHGGSVRAESRGLDQGASFIVRLPLIAQNQLTENQRNQIKDNARIHSIGVAAGGAETRGVAGTGNVGGKTGFNPETVDQAPKLDGLRVLAVDDDSDARDLIRTILTQCGAIVETAASTDQALTVFERPEEWQPELLISDIEMPEADGYQLIRKLREVELQRGRRIPAIALTAYARAEDRLRSLAAGFQMHVTKPVEPAELLTIVASLTGRLNRPRSLYEVSDVMRQEARNC